MKAQPSGTELGQGGDPCGTEPTRRSNDVLVEERIVTGHPQIDPDRIVGTDQHRATAAASAEYDQSRRLGGRP
jgi:hypothetical protein